MGQSESHANMQGDSERDLLAKLKASPDSVAVLFQLHTYYKEQARYEEEAAILRQILEKDLSADERAEAIHDLAYALYRQDNFEEAILHAESLLNTYPNYCYLGSLFWLLGEMYNIRSTWQRSPEAEHEDAEAAERYLKKALDLVDDLQERAAILSELGAALGSSGRLEESRAVLERALEVGITNPITAAACYEQLGKTLHMMGQIEQARLYREQSVRVHPGGPDNALAITYVNLARLCRLEGDVEHAEQYCQRAWQALDQSSPKTAVRVVGCLHEELGDISFEKREYQQAVEHYQTALEQDRFPDEEPILYRKMSSALTWTDQYDRALEALRKALAIAVSSQPTDEAYIGELLFDMGQCAYNLHDYPQSIMLLQKATDMVELPLLAEAHLLLAHSYFSLKRYEKAAQMYEQVIKETERQSLQQKEAEEYLLAAKRARRAMH